MTILEHLGRRLAAARELRGLTLEEAAYEAFLDPRELTLIEAGGAEPNFDEIGLLALVYRVSMDDLVGGLEPSPATRPTDADRTAEGERGNAGMSADASSSAQASRTNGHGRLPLGNGSARITLPPRTIDTPAARSLLKIVAIVLGTVILVGAVGVGTAALWPKPPRDVIKTLSYQDALLILVDSKETEKRRELSAGRVFGATRAGIKTLGTLGQEDTALGKQARRSLIQLQDLFGSTRRFMSSDRADVNRLHESPLELANRIKDAKQPLGERTRAHGQLLENLTLGILALKKADADPSLPRGLRPNVSAYLTILGKELGN